MDLTSKGISSLIPSVGRMLSRVWETLISGQTWRVMVIVREDPGNTEPFSKVIFL